MSIVRHQGAAAQVMSNAHAAVHNPTSSTVKVRLIMLGQGCYKPAACWDQSYAGTETTVNAKIVHAEAVCVLEVVYMLRLRRLRLCMPRLCMLKLCVLETFSCPETMLRLLEVRACVSKIESFYVCAKHFAAHKQLWRAAVLARSTCKRSNRK
ncbi:hypothetical protein DUNSADRAFT_13635 [Dunaliella salina]|uniref:Encoded protein n=1 Tax=Dunaliella salina TaxID=3046 RepID=A0ABQ7G903_DUNSA|nr:hypothetical protein DUNSADRAFT_13635 [Dunaliella salina]|eukprot:KAF5831078.1 hypothetical protein DUNSADRAFT_13635 [Dunaliella salina]